MRSTIWGVRFEGGVGSPGESATEKQAGEPPRLHPGDHHLSVSNTLPSAAASISVRAGGCNNLPHVHAKPFKGCARPCSDVAIRFVYVWHAWPCTRTMHTVLAWLWSLVDCVVSLLQELLIQQRGLRNLILRNRDMPIELMQKAAGDGVGGGNGPTPLQLPFMIIQASSEAKVELQMSEDSTQVQFDFHRCADDACAMANAAYGVRPGLQLRCACTVACHSCICGPLIVILACCTHQRHRDQLVPTQHAVQGARRQRLAEDDEHALRRLASAARHRAPDAASHPRRAPGRRAGCDCCRRQHRPARHQQRCATQ